MARTEEKLADQKCVPCHSDMPPLKKEEAADLARQIPGWTLKEKEIEREFRFKNFKEAINFINEVAEIANKEDHHPDIFISYSKVKLTLSTHNIGGLSKNDFILAAKVNELL